jgi:hypothetical protein
MICQCFRWNENTSLIFRQPLKIALLPDGCVVCHKNAHILRKFKYVLNFPN